MKFPKSIHGLILCAALALSASAIWPSAAQPSASPNNAPTAEVVSADAPAPGGLGVLGGILALVALGTVATAAIDTPQRQGDTIVAPVAASTTLYAGTLVARNAAGNIVAASATAGLTVVGRCEADADNSAGAAGDITVTIKRGVFRFANSGTAAVDADDEGKLCYVEDNTTVCETATLRVVAGRVVDVDSTGVWVDTRDAGALTIVRNTLIDADGATLTAAQSGLIVSNLGASGAAVFALPAATPGLNFLFVVEAAQELRIDPDGTETIALPSSGVQGAAGKYLTADAVAERVSLVCLTAGTWDVLDYVGTWTAEA
jgi:hypothetical protein